MNLRKVSCGNHNLLNLAAHQTANFNFNSHNMDGHQTAFDFNNRNTILQPTEVPP